MCIIEELLEEKRTLDFVTYHSNCKYILQHLHGGVLVHFHFSTTDKGNPNIFMILTEN